MKVAILMDNGFEELEAMGPIALLRRSGLDVDLVAVEGNSMTGRFGVTYSPTFDMSSYDFNQADCLIIPGGPHYKKIQDNKAVLDLIREFSEHKIIAAICAAPTILGKLGLLKSKKYTCFKDMNEDFGGEYQYQYTVTDGNVITAISAAASIEFAYAIIEKLQGKEHLQEVKKSIYCDAKHS
ncbi:MAG: DJ-1/PfpI family protein [Erysipelotrichaceae bacterium]|nr:DJ-1/PfpI family protein [Erysipelotrichaceae bacterium]